MPSPEYTRFRKIAEANNKTMDASHPCRKGRGRCCESIYASPGDLEVIMEAIRSGKIEQHIVKKAVERAKNNRDKCAFLNEQNLCSIYVYRPIICIMTGSTAVPRSAEAAKQLQNARVLGLKGLPFSQLTSTMCPECHSKLEAQGKGVSVQALEDTQELLLFLRKNPSWLNVWLLENFGQESAKKHRRR